MEGAKKSAEAPRGDLGEMEGHGDEDEAGRDSYEDSGCERDKHERRRGSTQEESTMAVCAVLWVPLIRIESSRGMTSKGREAKTQTYRPIINIATPFDNPIIEAPAMKINSHVRNTPLRPRYLVSASPDIDPTRPPMVSIVTAIPNVDS